jgi:hypothetical protein
MKLSNHLAARACALPLLAAIAASTLPAQHMFEVYPSRPDTSWTPVTTTRLGLGASAGEILMHIPGSHFRSVGNSGNGACDCKLFRRFEVRFWDGNRATSETFTPIIRAWTGTEPGVQLNPATIAMTTPVGPAGPGLVSLTMYSLSPYISVPISCQDGFCIGVRVGPATYSGTVLTEGLAVLAAGYETGATVPLTGDYTRPTAEQLRLVESLQRLGQSPQRGGRADSGLRRRSGRAGPQRGQPHRERPERELRRWRDGTQQ